MRQSRGSLIWFLFSPRGRVSRSEFWVFHLTLAILAFLGLLAIGLTYTPYRVGSGAVSLTAQILIGYAIIGLLALAVLSSLAVSAKRFHDRGRPGWWALIGLVPVIGSAWLVVECGCLRGTSGPNRYGPDPLGGGSEALSEVFD